MRRATTRHCYRPLRRLRPAPQGGTQSQAPQLLDPRHATPAPRFKRTLPSSYLQESAAGRGTAPLGRATGRCRISSAQPQPPGRTGRTDRAMGAGEPSLPATFDPGPSDDPALPCPAHAAARCTLPMTPSSRCSMPPSQGTIPAQAIGLHGCWFARRSHNVTHSGAAPFYSVTHAIGAADNK